MTALVLIIEDDPNLSELMASALEGFGYKTVRAENGLAGLEKLEDFQPDVILCDRSMPTLTGDALLGRLRGLYPQYRSIPFIFVTASAAHERVALDDLKPFAVLGKPVDFAELNRTIKRALA